MKRIYFDTETSGFKPGSIGQLSVIIEEDSKVTTYNKYFELDFIIDSALETTHRDLNFYKEASKGIRFKDCKDEILDIFSNALVIAHNEKFDMMFLSTEFWRCDIIFKPKSEFDSMTYFKDKCKLPSKRGSAFKNPKLEEIADYLGIDKDKVNHYAKKLFNVEGQLDFHDAMYDTTMLYICIKVEADIKNNTDFFKHIFT